MFVTTVLREFGKSYSRSPGEYRHIKLPYLGLIFESPI